ncbi:hypothetical protein PR048_017168 [Dryococelus australis]|uniref:Uncharacterized protein n=1 Tax=Dryococelus australis TaxID=614101 RepID=A0ABQ9H8R9_9NEOP|nr:hypothetical protein PR048_017168 [Dryococelus australis]
MSLPLRACMYFNGLTVGQACSEVGNDGLWESNKADCGADRVVRKEDGERLAREYSVAFMETSAKTGMNVELTFMAVARQLKCRRSEDPDETKFNVQDYVREQAQRGSCPPCTTSLSAAHLDANETTYIFRQRLKLLTLVRTCVCYFIDLLQLDTNPDGSEPIINAKSEITYEILQQIIAAVPKGNEPVAKPYKACANHAQLRSENPPLTELIGAAVAERLVCSPPTKANRVQSPASPPPDFLMWKSSRKMPLVSGFSWGCHVFPPSHSDAAPYSSQSFSPALKHSILYLVFHGEVVSLGKSMKVFALVVKVSLGRIRVELIGAGRDVPGTHTSLSAQRCGWLD